MGGPYELPGTPGRFSYRGLSFLYPASWEMVITNGYIGPSGLWIVPLGVDAVDRVLVTASYYPWQYSTRQMRVKTNLVLDEHVQAQGWRILRPPKPVRTGGVIVHWADMAGLEASGVLIRARIYLFAWNDVLYYFECQEAIDSRSGIIRGCDQILSTLRLGATV